MYRPPEMCDLYSEFEVSLKVDVWMLGCVIFTLCYYFHPFVDSSKIGIINACFKIPSDSKFGEKLNDLIRHLITPNPKFRPNIDEVLKILNNYYQMPNINLNVFLLIKI